MRSIKTPRLHLRPLRMDDEDIYCSIYTNVELMRHVGAPLSIEAAQRSLRTVCEQAPGNMRWMLWVVCELTSRSRVGLVGLVRSDERNRAEIGAMMVTHEHRNGYATEALRALISHAFNELDLSHVWGHHPSSNNRSTGLMSKLGFVAVPPVSDKLDCRWELSRDRWEAKFQGDCSIGPTDLGSEILFGGQA